MNIQQLISSEGKTSRQKASHPILLMSRIRLARNIEGFSFPGWSDSEKKLQIYELCRGAIEQVEEFSPCIHFSIESLDKNERQYLVERHLISKELCEGEIGAGVTIDDTRSMSIMINEEDHLRIQVMSPGLSFDSIWNRSDAIDNALEKQLNYSFRENLGYLTACPTNLGTGMRASVMLHLPGLVLTKQMEKVVRAVNQLGIVARGIFGESSDPSGSVFQISNQQTLGESESEIIHRLENVIRTIIVQEANARIRLFEQDEDRVVDRICRAFGVLRYANMLSSSEAMNLLSMLRFASDIQIMPANVRTMVDDLIMNTQPSHLQFDYGGILDSNQRDLLRAQKIREKLSSIVEPNPSDLDFTLLKSASILPKNETGGATSGEPS